MKRGFIILIILMLLVSPIVLSVEDDSQISEQKSALERWADSIASAVENSSQTEAQKSESKSALMGGIDEGTPDLLDQTVNLPKEFEFIYWIVRGSETISWAELIVFLLILFVIFLGGLEILSYTSFETDWVKYLISGSIAVVASITGTISNLLSLFYKFVDNVYYIAGGFLIILIALLIIRPIVDKIKNQNKISKAEGLGTLAGVVLKGQSEEAEAVAKAAR